MKPEEAINQIEELITIDNTALVYLPDFRDAFELAVESLKEMSAEEYRQRLMEVFHKTDHDELLTYVVMPKEEEFKSLEYILRQHKFEPRPHGEWIDTRNFPVRWTCSECGRRDTHIYNFCPDCGAKMR